MKVQERLCNLPDSELWHRIDLAEWERDRAARSAAIYQRADRPEKLQEAEAMLAYWDNTKRLLCAEEDRRGGYGWRLVQERRRLHKKLRKIRQEIHRGKIMLRLLWIFERLGIRKAHNLGEHWRQVVDEGFYAVEEFEGGLANLERYATGGNTNASHF